MFIKIYSIVFVSFIFCICGCGSSDSTHDQNIENIDSTQVILTPIGKIQPTSIRQNASSISGVIESLRLKDDTEFQLSIKVSSVKPVDTMENFVVIGQQITISPQYFLDSLGAIDMRDVRNKRLLSVKSSKPGDFLRGKISLREDGKWVLIEVEDN